MDFFADLSALFLPYRCIVCQRELISTSLCFRCTPQTSIYTIEPPERSSPIRSLRFIWEYDDVSRDFIHVMKYQPSKKLAYLAGRFLSLSFEDTSLKDTWDLAVPIPSSKATLKERGFNQCELIASKLPLEVEKSALQIRGVRKRQAITPIERRSLNIRDAFICYKNLSAKRILLIDDVVTTGATAREAARALLAAGALTVDVAALVKANSYV